MSPDFCGLETRQMTAQDYWNFTTLETGEYFDKKIDTKTMFKNNVYLTDDQGDAVLRLGPLCSRNWVWWKIWCARDPEKIYFDP